MIINIRALREKKGQSQKEIAEILGRTQQAIALWESGKRAPRADMLPRIAALYGCTIDELYDGNEREEVRETHGKEVKDGFRKNYRARLRDGQGANTRA